MINFRIVLCVFRDKLLLTYFAMDFIRVEKF